MKKIVIVSGSRAEFSLLKPLIRLLNSNNMFEVLFVVTGSHLNSIHNNSKKEIDSSKISISSEIEMQINSDTNVGMAKSIGLGVISFADYFNSINPDLLLNHLF